MGQDRLAKLRLGPQVPVLGQSRTVHRRVSQVHQIHWVSHHLVGIRRAGPKAETISNSMYYSADTVSGDSRMADIYRCLQEVSYLTSPQAMNPLPNRPLLSNTSIPLTLPNVPSFDSMAYSGRPRKVMPEVGKDFPILNGMSGLLSGPTSAPAGTGNQSNPLDRAGILGSAVHSSQQQHITGPPLGPQVQLQSASDQGQTYAQQQSDAKDPESITQQPMSDLFRPNNETNQWRETLNLNTQATEEGRASQPAVPLMNAASPWERREEDIETKGEEEPESEEDEQSEIGESDGNRIWKAKRTLRKSVSTS